MADYQVKRTTFQGKGEPYKKVSNEFMKAQETKYNPITQTYTND